MIRIYNTKSKRKEDFIPIDDKHVGIYVCGPTVYDIAHLGHGRSAVAFDVIRRYLIWSGYDVKFVSNYTDIDDKMIMRASDEGITVAELAEKIIPRYEVDYGKLGVLSPDNRPRATENIDSMINLITKLQGGGYVYTIDGDGVYFDVSKFKDYGNLSGQNLEDLKMGARIEVNKKKKNPYDFAVWKFKKEGEPAFKSPFGEGRPGWHIECSAMSYKILGRQFDIHGGGLDLQFPHHECEIAQSVCALGEGSFARYWMHNGFINVDNEKMSKSLGNFKTLQDIFKIYDPIVVRYMYLQTHYRNPINFSDELLSQAKSALERIHGFLRTLKVSLSAEDSSSINAEEEKKKFKLFMDNDFDTSGALGVVFELIKRVNTLKIKNSFTVRDAVQVEKFLRDIDKVLFVIYEEEEALASDVEKLIKEREEARANRDFQKSDRIRDELHNRGIELEDTPSGTLWKRI